MVYSTTYHGNSSIGIFSVACDNIAFVPPDAPGKFIYAIKERLGVDVVKTSLMESNLLGIYGRAYRDILLIPYNVSEREERLLKEYVDVVKVKTKWNAIANNIVFNDRGAIINPELGRDVKSFLEDALGVEIAMRKIANYPTVGSLLVVSDRGAIVHYKASDDDLNVIKDIFGLKYYPIKTTVNLGVGFVKIGLINNNRGYVVGEGTTGIEVSRIEEGLYSD